MGPGALGGAQVSDAALSLVDGNFHVPLFGLSESLNVSVCVAMTMQLVRSLRVTACGLAGTCGHHLSFCCSRPLL